MTGAHSAGLRRMLGLVEALPDQLQQSRELPGLGEALAGLSPAPRRIILCGMGGSAIAGDLVGPLVQGGGTSLTVWRGYGLPGWATAEDLVLVSSYSGNTEETLSGAAAAVETGCRMLGFCSGGDLSRLAERQGFPCVRLPGGLPPRASLGLGLGVLVQLLEGLGVFPGGTDGLAAAADWLLLAAPARRTGGADSGPRPEAADPDRNPSPGDLARTLVGRIPVIFTAGTEAHGPGRRLQAQLNENSKIPAWCAPFPELDHNALVGWSLGADERDGFVLMVLESGIADPRLARRIPATLDLLREEFSSIVRLSARSEDPLARVLSLVQYGDFLSCHLAGLRGVDPVPVDRIEQLKQTLFRSDS